MEGVIEPCEFGSGSGPGVSRPFGRRPLIIQLLKHYAYVLQRSAISPPTPQPIGGTNAAETLQKSPPLAFWKSHHPFQRLLEHQHQR
jgi:hypothetical protein